MELKLGGAVSEYSANNGFLVQSPINTHNNHAKILSIDGQ